LVFIFDSNEPDPTSPYRETYHSAIYERLKNMKLKDPSKIWWLHDLESKSNKEAINDAIAAFKEKWKKENTNNIRVIVQKNSEEPMLWAVDYVLWTIQRAYEKISKSCI